MTGIIINHTGVAATVTSPAIVSAAPRAEAVTVLLTSAACVSDHGELTGLADDDHLHYLTEARGDARYDVLGHGHDIADVAGLASAIAGKMDADTSAIRSTATADDAVIEVAVAGGGWTEALRVARSTGLATFRNALQWLGNSNVGAVVWRFVAPTAGDPTAPNFNASVRTVQWDNGPSGQTAYKDHTFHLGWNFLHGQRESTSQSAFGISFESKFYQNGVFAHEWHIQGEDANGIAFRPFGLFIPTNQRSGSIATFKTDFFNLKDDAGNDRISMTLAGAAPRVNVAGSTQFWFSGNNVPTLQQMDSFGSFRALPYIDNLNRIAVGAGLFVNATTADSEYGSVCPVNVSALAANKSIYYAQANAITGSFYAAHWGNLAATGTVKAVLGNGTVNGHAAWQITTRTGTGDPLITFLAADEAMNYSVGVDQSASAFKISAGHTRLGGSSGTEDRVIVNDTVIEVKRGLKLPSYTVAGLPSAGASGAGTLVYVSNAAGGPTLACSDGSTWRIAAALGATVT